MDAVCVVVTTLLCIATVSLLALWKLPVVLNVIFALVRPKEKEGSAPFPPLVPVDIRGFLAALVTPDAPFFFLDLARRHGPVYRLPIGPGCGAVFIGDHKTARQVLDDPSVVKPRRSYRAFDRLVGARESFFTANDARYRHVRKATAAVLGAKHVERMRVTIKAVLDKFVEDKLEPKARKGEALDIDLAMQWITTRVIFQAGFEYELSEEEMHDLWSWINQVLLENFRSAAVNPLRALLPSIFPHARKAKRATRHLRSFAKRILDSYRSNPDRAGGTIIAAISEDDDYISDEERVTDMLVFVLAGYDTTAHTLAWALLELARNPEEQQRLHNDLTTLQSSDKGTNPLQSLALQNIIRETLRLHAAAALGSVRQATKDFNLQEYAIPKGTSITMPYFIIHRDEKVFERPDSFLPQRWAGDDAPPSDALVGFSSGRRNCIGQALAMAELNVVLARLCSEYEWRVENEGRQDYFMSWKTVGTKLVALRRET